MLILLNTVLWFAMSQQANSPLQWGEPLSRKECEAIERASDGIWCHPVGVIPAEHLHHGRDISRNRRKRP